MTVHKVINQIFEQVNDSATDTYYIDFGTIANRVLTQLIVATDDAATGLYFSVGECDDGVGTGLIPIDILNTPNTRLTSPNCFFSLSPVNPILLKKRFWKIETNQPVTKKASFIGAYMEYPTTHPINTGSGLLRRTLTTISSTAVTTILSGPADLTEAYLIKSVRVFYNNATPTTMRLSIVDSALPAHTPFSIVPEATVNGEGFEFLRNLEPEYVAVNNLTIAKNQDLKIQTGTTNPVNVIVTYSVVT